MPITDIVSKIENRQATVGIIGLGYVPARLFSGGGLPLALCFAEKGFGTIGFDIDESKAYILHAGKSYIKHISEEHNKSELDRFIRTKRTTNASEQRKWIEARLDELKRDLEQSENKLKEFREKKGE